MAKQIDVAPRGSSRQLDSTLTPTPVEAPASDLRQLSPAAISRGVEFGADFDKWYREFTPLVQSFVAQAVKPSQREDTAQEIWMQIAKSLAHYDPTRSQPQTWVMLISRRTIIDLSRRAKSRPTLITETDLSPRNEDTSNPLEMLSAGLFKPHIRTQSPEAQDFEKIIARFEELSPQARDVLTLKYFRGLTMVQVAQLLDMPEGTVKSTVSRSLRSLRRKEAA